MTEPVAPLSFSQTQKRLNLQADAIGGEMSSALASPALYEKVRIS